MMRRLPLLCVLILILSLVAISGRCEEKPPVFLIEVDGIISPPIAKFIIESIDRAAEKGGQCLIIQLDTPGGLMDSMRDIVKKILTSNIPIIVYVAPSGAIGEVAPATQGGAF